MNDPLLQWWMMSANVGDVIGPWITRRLCGRDPAYVDVQSPYRKYVTVGSVLNNATPDSVVWGSGLASMADTVHPYTHIYAVRGPLTRLRARACQTYCPDVYGDPALVASRLYTPAVAKTHRLGIIAHFKQQHLVMHPFVHPGVKVINILLPVERFVDEVASCERIASSALHGIILAHAYGVPASWVDFGPPIGGDGMKFVDYFLSVDVACSAPSVVPSTLSALASIDDLLRLPFVLPDAERLRRLVDRLLDVCPLPMEKRP